MRTVTLGIASHEAAKKRALRAFEGEFQGTFITFDSPFVLFQVLSGERWELLEMMTGSGPMTVREVASRLGRAVQGVKEDIHALLKAGILQKTVEGLIEFPFDAVHVDFMLKAA